MGKKGMSPQERREYERLQERKKRQMEKRYAKSMGIILPSRSRKMGEFRIRTKRGRRKEEIF